LKFRAPSGALTDEHRQSLRTHKQWVIEFLRGRTRTAELTPDAAARHQPFPLTDVQAAYLVGRSAAHEYGNIGCHGYFEIDYEDLDLARLEAGWNALIERHDMLRAVIDRSGSQRVQSTVPHYAIEIADMRGCTSQAEDDRLAATRAELSHRVYEPDTWPLFAVRVSRRSSGVRLHVSLDLLIADFLSIQILLSELGRLYAEGPSSLAPLSLAFRDCVLAERAQAGSASYERARSYWHERLAGLPERPDLPLLPAPRRDGRPTFRRLAFVLGRRELESLHHLAGQRGLTGSAAILAAYAEVVTRWSRSPRFTLNLTVLQRPPGHADVAHIVGDFTSVNLLEIDRSKGATLAERGSALLERLWEDMDHRQYGGVRVLRDWARERGTQSALMPVVYTSTLGLRSAAGDGPLFDGKTVFGISQTPQVWIDCQVSETRGELHANWDVLEGVFPEGVVEAMFEAFTSLLRRMSRDPEVWDARNPIELPEDQRRRRAAANATAVPLPSGLLHAPILDVCERSPDRIAVIDGETRITYRELLQRALGIADALARADVSPGSRVAVALDKGWEQVASVLGVLLCGAAYVPVDVQQPALRIQRILENARCAVVLVQDAEREPVAAGVSARVLAVCDVAVKQGPVPAAACVPKDPAYLIYTSGSTGDPKGVLVSHQAALNTVVDIIERFGVTAVDRSLALASLAFDLSVFDIFGLLAVGGTLVIAGPEASSDPARWAEVATRHGVTLWNSVPAQLDMLTHFLDAHGEPRPRDLRLFLVSGDFIPLSLPDRVRRHYPESTFVSLGGATEAAIWSIRHVVHDVLPEWTSIPYGFPLKNQACHVVDADGEDCPDWVPGEIQISGSGLALEYFRDPERTASRFVAGAPGRGRCYRTGDWGRYRGNGEIEILGRMDDQVKVRGHRVELGEIEAALQSHPSVASAVAVVRSAGDGERQIVAVAQPVARPETPAEREVATGPVFETARRTSAETSASVPRAAISQQAQSLDRIALLAMTRALDELGAFRHAGEAHTAAQLIESCGIAPAHVRLFERWLAVLAHEGFLRAVYDPGTAVRYRDLRVASRGDLEAAWKTCDAAQDEIGRGAELLRYLRLSIDNLPGLMRGKVDPLALLFPEGRLETAESAYRDNVISGYLNGLVNATVRAIAGRRSPQAPLRLLEVGAGVGGTSTDLIATLRDRPVDYLFTDVSTFFLEEARAKFGAESIVRFGLFDLNQPFRQQGYSEGAFDVIVCANVLHNSVHAAEVLARLRELLAPGGWLVFLEATRDNYQLMTSMEFKEGLTDFRDHRAETHTTFIAREAWLQLLGEAGAASVLCLPEESDPLGAAGQHFFAARFPADREDVRPEVLLRHCGERLPEAMIPSHVEVVRRLPLTQNGKVDRKQVVALLPSSNAKANTAGVAPRNETEETIATMVQEVLGVAAVGVEDDFFRIGGDSLLVAKLIGRVRERYEGSAPDWDTLLRAFLQEPTVAGLSAALQTCRRAPTAERSSSSPLVMLRKGSSPQTAILVHEGSGTLHPYRNLLSVVDPTLTVAGFVVRDADEYLGHDEDTLVERLAERYVGVLREQWTPGECHLVGYCMGGLIAFEMARKLAESGTPIGSLRIVSSYKIPYLVEDDVLIEYAFVRALGLPAIDLGFPGDEVGLGRALARVLAETPGRVGEGAMLTALSDLGDMESHARLVAVTQRRADERLSEYARRFAKLVSAEPGQLSLATLFRIFRHGVRGVTLHEPALYAGDLTFFRQRGETQFLPGLGADMEVYWKSACVGRTHVVDVPGDHFSCMSSQSVDRWARELVL